MLTSFMKMLNNFETDIDSGGREKNYFKIQENSRMRAQPLRKLIDEIELPLFWKKKKRTSCKDGFKEIAHSYLAT